LIIIHYLRKLLNGKKYLAVKNMAVNPIADKEDVHKPKFPDNSNMLPH